MSEDAPLPQEHLIEGRYRIVRQLAQGGMATVYEAKDERLDRTVALKVMHTQLAQGPHREQFIERFRREAQSAAQIANPHIVQVYDAGETNGLAYLVMEYVHGVNLRHEMNRQGTFSVRETLRIVAETLDGLASAHRANVVHRDIKPENIMLNDRGRVQITDFGLAKVASAATLSSTGMLLGTAAYLPPETIERNEATPQGDLYAVGIMAWEMLTGEVPFTSDNPVTLVFKHVHEDVPSVRELCPGIDPAVAAFISHLTARAIDDRPANAGEALQELRNLSAGLSIEAWQYRKAAGAVSDSPAAPPKPPTQAIRDDDGVTATAVFQPAQHDTIVAQIPTTAIDTASTQVLRNANEPDVSPTSPDAHDASQPGPTATGKRRTILIATLIATLLAAAVAGGSMWWYFLGPGSYWTLPQPNDISCQQGHSCALTGAQWTSYKSTLKVAGIPHTTKRDYSDTVSKGHIIAASVNGRRVGVNDHVSKRNGASLSVVVSRGVKTATIPSDITDPNSENGKNPIEALRKAGFTRINRDESNEEYSTELPEGALQSIDKNPGTTLKHNEAITVSLSKGPMPVSMPDIVGRSKDEARQALDELKLKANYSEEFSDSVAAGTVISASVKKDTQLHWGDSVDVVVSKGPETVTLPNYVGQRAADAKSALEKLGFSVDIKSKVTFDSSQDKKVASQDPVGGTQVRLRQSDGTPTTITLNMYSSVF